MLDSSYIAEADTAFDLTDDVSHPSRSFTLAKRGFDIMMSVALLPLLGLFCVILLIMNPLRNRGPLFYRQVRMGYRCARFEVIKFRSMVCAESIARNADDPLETNRITSLGRFIRKTRIDELPQILNVLRGEMSLIGPRPDYIEHATYFVENVPGYRQRHIMRPGISGLAQTRLGYAEGMDQTRAKVNADLEYIQTASFGTDTRIVIDTLRTVLGGFGR